MWGAKHWGLLTVSHATQRRDKWAQPAHRRWRNKATRGDAEGLREL
jgi:hypothetical protein